MYLGIYVKLYDWLRKKYIEKSNRKMSGNAKCGWWQLWPQNCIVLCIMVINIIIIIARFSSSNAHRTIAWSQFVCIQIWFCIFCVKYPRSLWIETIIFSWHKKHAFMFSTGPSELGFRVHLLDSKLKKLLNILFWQKNRCFFKRTVNRSNWRQIHKNSWNHCRFIIST